MANDRHTMFYMGKEYPNFGGGSGSGGGFDKTNLYTNSGTGFENTVTLSDDFDNYDYLEFVTYKSDDGTYDDALNEKFISKEILTELLNNSMTAKSDAFMLIGDPHNGAQYARYSVASKTSFSKVWTNGNWTLKEINGINLSGGGSGGGTSVEANPNEDATEELTKLKVGADVYYLPHSGAEAKTLVYTLQGGSQWFTFSNPNSDLTKEMLLKVEMPKYDMEQNFKFVPSDLPNREGGDNYTTIGYVLISGVPINLGQKYGGSEIWISTNGGLDTNRSQIKIYNIG